jgi:hypothetical protein
MPLHYASANGHIGVIGVLMNEGPDCEAEDAFGDTSITFAVFGRNISVIKHFIGQNASLQHAGKWGYTPILDAVFEDSHEILE